MSWVNFRCKSTGSLLSGAMTTENMVERTKTLGYKSACIMDYGSISLSYEFSAECKKAGLKAIIGIEAFVCEQDSHIMDESNRKLTRIGIVCKNLAGWKSLCKAVSQSNRNFYKKPRLAIDEWAAYANDNWIIITGFPGTKLSKLDNLDCRYNHLENLQLLFGKNVYIGIQGIADDKNNIKLNREVASLVGIDCIALADSHYVLEEDAPDQRVLLCSLLKTTLPKVNANLSTEEAKDIDVERFFKSDKYYIPSLEELKKYNTDEEINNTLKLEAKCEEYSLNNNPILPKFEEGIDAYEVLTQKCRDGWKLLLNFSKNDPRHDIYRDRIKDELRVIKSAGLSNYFLIVADICDYARKNNILMGFARGSAGGCLISYLIGITRLDPIPYKLLFSRFFNESRKNSLPDIDLDFQPSKREEIIQYIQSKYGENSVCKIATFGRLQGRGAIKEVLRVHEATDNTTMNEITKNIPDESKIADELQEMAEDNHEDAKILYWAVVNNAKKLAPWVKLEDDGSYSGEFGKYFAQAIRLEGLYRQIGEHASGIVIVPGNIDDYCPLIKSKKGLIAGMPYPDLEAMGIAKIDILGVNVLDKLKMIINAAETGDIYGCTGDSIEVSAPDSEAETSDNYELVST